MILLEVIAAAALGALLLWLALGALGTRPADAGPEDFDPIDETPRGRALLALKELEFDRETGKLADPDYRSLKEKLSREAIAVLAPATTAPDVPAARAAAVTCVACGPRPEPDAIFCSSCGRRLTGLAA